MQLRVFIVPSLCLALACSLVTVPAAGEPALLLADLKSFLHGTPAPPPKSPPPKERARVSTDARTARDVQVEGFMQALADGIMARDGQALLPRLADKYAIDDLPADMKPRELFLQAVERIPGPSEMTIKAVDRRADTRVATVEFRYPDDKVSEKTFWFDADGRLLRSDFFRLQRVGGS